MPPQLPKVVLPKFEVMAKSPINALSEIRNSISATAASIEAALPKGLPMGGQGGGLKFPRIEEIFKGPGAAAEEIKSTFEMTLGGLAPGSQSSERGTITKKEEPKPSGSPARGSL